MYDCVNDSIVNLTETRFLAASGTGVFRNKKRGQDPRNYVLTSTYYPRHGDVVELPLKLLPGTETIAISPATGGPCPFSYF